MDLKSKKGYALIMALFFVIISAITSLGLYTYAYYVSNQVGIQEPASSRRYYASIGGARYAYILLKDPLVNLKGSPSAAPYVTGGGITTLAHDGETVTLTITSTSALGIDLDLMGNETLTITIQEYDPVNPPDPLKDPAWAPGNYKLTSGLTP